VKKRKTITTEQISIVDDVMLNGGTYIDASKAAGLARCTVYKIHNRQGNYASVPVTYFGERLPGGAYGSRRSVPVEVVPMIDELRSKGHTLKEIAIAFSCDVQTIGRASNRKGTYKNVPK